MDYTDAMCTGAQLDTPVVTAPSRTTEYAEKIERHWQTVADIFEVARLCHEAHKKLSSVEKRELFLQLPFDRTVFSKLAKIGADPRLRCPEIQELLPPSYSLQYELAKLDYRDFKAAFEEHIIHPRVRRAEFLKWAKCRQEGVHKEVEKKYDAEFRKLRAAWIKSPKFRTAWEEVPVRVRKQFVTDVLQIRIA